MKLLLCLDCHDVVKFGPPMQWRACLCGRSSARYLADGVCAQFSGANARAIGVDNHTVARAVRSLERHPEHDDFTTFPRLDAWVYPAGHYHLQHIDREAAQPAPAPARKLTRLDLLETRTPPETVWDDEPFPLPPVPGL